MSHRQPSSVTMCRTATIYLSKRHMENAERIRDTILHELCHVAVWTIDRVSSKTDGSHGPVWKRWTQHAESVHPDINKVGVYDPHISSSKYLCECTGCGFDIGLNSPLSENKHVKCPYCNGDFRDVHMYDKDLEKFFFLV